MSYTYLGGPMQCCGAENVRIQFSATRFDPLPFGFMVEDAICEACGEFVTDADTLEEIANRYESEDQP